MVAFVGLVTWDALFGAIRCRRRVRLSMVMGVDAGFVVPVNFSGVDVLVQATEVSVVGSEPTSAASRVVAAYAQAEEAILGVAESVAGTVAKLAEGVGSPQQVQVQFGVSVSLEGDVLVVKGTSAATLAITLTYDRAC